jgi:hypothetical protein
MVFYLGISSILRYGPNSRYVAALLLASLGTPVPLRWPHIRCGHRYYMFSDDPVIKGDDERSYNVLSSTGYRNSLLYAACNLVPIALAGLFGYLLVRCAPTLLLKVICGWMCLRLTLVACPLHCACAF